VAASYAQSIVSADLSLEFSLETSLILPRYPKKKARFGSSRLGWVR
jgi:hypothetical protein